MIKKAYCTAASIVVFERSGKRQVGYWLGRKFWGKGIASRALADLLALVPERPLYAFAAKQNVASRRVLEKNGFKVAGEGTAPPIPGAEPVEEYMFRLEA